MKTFAGIMPLKRMVTNLKRAGYRPDLRRYIDGSDFADFSGNGIHLTVNTFNGRFLVFAADGTKIATEASSELDNTAWYMEILDAIYIPGGDADE